MSRFNADLISLLVSPHFAIALFLIIGVALLFLLVTKKFNVPKLALFSALFVLVFFSWFTSLFFRGQLISGKCDVLTGDPCRIPVLNLGDLITHKKCTGLSMGSADGKNLAGDKRECRSITRWYLPTTWEFEWNQRVVESAPVYSADFSNDQVLTGASHNVFIARILRQINTVDIGFGPETQFEVEIVDNLKGALEGVVVVNQMGGYRDGVLYVVEVGESMDGDHRAPENYMLRPGSTYLLATRYNEKEDWHTLNSFHTASKLLSSDENADMITLREIAETDTRVQELRAAYPNEILIDADVASGKTYNSYVSLQEGAE